MGMVVAIMDRVTGVASGEGAVGVGNGRWGVLGETFKRKKVGMMIPRPV